MTTMRKMVLALATVLLFGAFAIAQNTQGTESDTTTNGQQENQQQENQQMQQENQQMQNQQMQNQQEENHQSYGNETGNPPNTTGTPQATGDPNKDSGIDKLNDLYREAEDPNNAGWLNPNVTRSSPGDVGQ